MTTLLTLASAAWGWLRSLTWREIIAGLVTLSMAFLYLAGKRKGRNEERRQQAARDMELSEQIRDRAHDAKERAHRDTGALDDDELRERMRAEGRLRD